MTANHYIDHDTTNDKGISLNLEQWEALKSGAEVIDTLFEEKTKK